MTEVMRASLNAGGREVRAHVGDVAAVALLLAFVTFASGAESFTFLHTPDSEFYFSLGAFGSEVTDRAPDAYYFWTKYGLNLPILALSEATDPWTARHIWRLLLVLIVLASTFMVARTRGSRVSASAAALFVALNTAVIGHIGDPYFAGTAIALLCAAISLTHRILFSGGGIPSSLLLGLCLAWLLMVNPYCLFVAFGAVAGIGATRLPWLARLGLLRLELLAFSTISGLAIGYTGFIVWGKRDFPGLDWLSYVKGFILTAPLDIFAEEGWAWLATETSLLVPVAAVLVTLGFNLQARRGSDPAALRSALGLVVTPAFLAVAYKAISGTAVLEAGYYSALLWPPALLGIVIVATTVGTDEGHRAASAAALMMSTAAWVIAGHVTATSIPWLMLAVTVATCTLIVVSLRDWPVPEAKAIFVVLGVLGFLFQLDQNGRPPRASGLIAERVSYASAYRSSHVANVLRRDLDFQQWLIASTGRREQIVLWTSGQPSMAAMQLWGPNGFSEDEQGDLRSSFDEPAPQDGQTIVTIASDPARSAEMEERLRAATSLDDPNCRDFATRGDPSDVARACILRQAE